MLRALNRSFRTSAVLHNEIEIFIDNKPLMVDPSYTVLQACQKAGMFVPHFCFHDRLAVAGNCRMCLVDIEKAPKPMVACAAHVAPGMRINTQSERTKNARGAVMEFLLANHPLDCPICDQGGECDLQDQSVLYGYKESRFLEYKRAVEDKDLGPLIKTIMTRCIHCTRCVRFSAEVAGMPILGTTGRGNKTEIGTYVKKLATSELSGNLVDLCPVGALTNSPYAFTARPWELRSIKSYDVQDPLSAAIVINARGPEVMRILPRIHDEINEEWLSDRQRHAYDGLKRQRLSTCYIKNQNGELVDSNWRDTLEYLADKISVLNGDEIAGMIGQNMDVEAVLAFQDLLHRLGCENVNIKRSHGLSPDFRGNYLFNTTVPGIEEADVMLIVGSNPRMESPVLNARIRKSVINYGLKVGVVGGGDDFTYEVDHLGNSPNTLKQLLDGTHPFSKKLENAQLPMVVVGGYALQRKDSDGLMSLISQICKKYNVINDEAQWNGFNILNKDVGSIAALELGIKATNPKNPPKLVFLLGCDDFKPDEIPKDAFVVYLGTHGDEGANIADVILPGATYTEKSATYVNLDGRTLFGRIVVQPAGFAKNDWEVLRALSEVLGVPLPYDNIDQLRYRLAELAPHLIKYDNIEPYNFTKFYLQEKAGEVNNTPLTTFIDNFYMTDPISRASPVMAQCSNSFNPIKLTNFAAKRAPEYQS